MVTVSRSIWFLIDRRIVNDGDRRDLVAQGCTRWWLFLFCTHIWLSVFQEPSRWGRHITLTLEDPGWILLAIPWQWLSKSNPVHLTEAQPTHPLLPTATRPHLPMNRWWRTSKELDRPFCVSSPSSRSLLTGWSKGKLLFDVFRASPALFQVFCGGHLNFTLRLLCCFCFWCSLCSLRECGSSPRGLTFLPWPREILGREAKRKGRRSLCVGRWRVRLS